MNEGKRKNNKNAWREELEKRRKIDRKKEMQKPDKDLAKGAGRTVDKSGFTRSRRSTQGGGSTIEILVAFVVITLALTAVVMVIFGNQSFAIDTKVTQRALYHAERGVEHAFASSTDDFSSLASFSLALSSLFPGIDADEIYADDKIGVKVTPISECVKMVESGLHWNYDTGNRARAASTTSIFVSTSTSKALGGDCVTEDVADDWSNPEAFENIDLDFKKSTDVSVFKNQHGRFAVLTSESSGVNGTVWIVDVSDPENVDPFITDSFDTENDMFGVTAVSINGGSYAFTVGATSTTRGQLRVFDVSNPNNMGNPIAHYELPNIKQNCGSSNLCRAGRSVYYYDERLYIGTDYLAFGSLGTNHELHIFNVSDPSNPVWEGSVNVDRNVNDIVARGGFAYLANGPGGTNDSLRVYDVSDPTSGNLVGDFEVDSGQPGTSLHILADKLYFGLERTTNQEKPTFYILDISDPTNPVELGAENTGIKKNTAVRGIEVVGRLAFVGTSDQEDSSGGGGPFVVYDISDPSNIVLVSTCGINFSERATGLDFVDNLAFMSKETPAGDGGLTIVYPAPACS